MTTETKIGCDECGERILTESTNNGRATVDSAAAAERHYELRRGDGTVHHVCDNACLRKFVARLA